MSNQTEDNLWTIDNPLVNVHIIRDKGYTNIYSFALHPSPHQPTQGIFNVTKEGHLPSEFFSDIHHTAESLRGLREYIRQYDGFSVVAPRSSQTIINGYDNESLEELD